MRRTVRSSTRSKGAISAAVKKRRSGKSVRLLETYMCPPRRNAPTKLIVHEVHVACLVRNALRNRRRPAQSVQPGRAVLAPLTSQRTAEHRETLAVYIKRRSSNKKCCGADREAVAARENRNPAFAGVRVQTFGSAAPKKPKAAMMSSIAAPAVTQALLLGGPARSFRSCYALIITPIVLRRSIPPRHPPITTVNDAIKSLLCRSIVPPRSGSVASPGHYTDSRIGPLHCL